MMLTGCGKDDDGGDIIGLWTYASYTLDCKNPSNPDLEEYEKGIAILASAFMSGLTMEFKADKTLIVNFFGEKETGTWEKSGNHYIFHSPDDDEDIYPICE